MDLFDKLKNKQLKAPHTGIYFGVSSSSGGGASAEIGYSEDSPGTVIDTTVGGSRYLEFLGSGYLTVSADAEIEFLLVGGGAGGGKGGGGGGGGGGSAVLRSNTFTIPASSGSGHRIVIGAGSVVDTDGTASTFNSETTGTSGMGGDYHGSVHPGTNGGGAGAHVPPTAASGGGAGDGASITAPGTAHAGFAGGNGSTFPPSPQGHSGGGGGGANGAGSPAATTLHGGAGIQIPNMSISGGSVTPYYYGGGGGGGGHSQTGGDGGIGGGGGASASAPGGGSARNAGGNATSTVAGAGGANTGGGGGGLGSSGHTGGTGGSGILVVKHSA